MGGLLAAVVFTAFAKDKKQVSVDTSMSSSMQMAKDSLVNKSGNDFDATFISEMIIHHQGAIDMAKLSATNANHDEIKQLSKEIIFAQEKEISQLRQWQEDWGYITGSNNHDSMSH